MAFWIFAAVVAGYVAAAGYTDFRMQRIPNSITVPTAIAGLVFSLVFWEPTTPWECLLGFGLGFGLFFIPFAAGGGGAGDLKLVAALGAWLGPVHLLISLALALIFATMLAFLVWTTSFSQGRRPRINKSIPKAAAGGEGLKPKAPRRRAVPFAIPMALATWCVLAGMILHKLHPEYFERENHVASVESPANG